MQQLYAPLISREFSADPSQPSVPVVVTDLASAEMIKYAANSFLATKISFINEIANICDRVGADVTQVAKGIGLDRRISPKFLRAGLGWGGSCFPKDVAALVHTAADYGCLTPVLEATVETNRHQRLLAIEKLQQTLKILKGKTIGLLGVTFKPNTDDLRDAPALDLMEHLQRLGAQVKAYDPLLSKAPNDLNLVATPEELASDCDALVLVTDWAEFKELNYTRLAALMVTPILIDGRNCLEPDALATAGFHYIGIGRPTPLQPLPSAIVNVNALAAYAAASAPH